MERIETSEADEVGELRVAVQQQIDDELASVDEEQINEKVLFDSDLHFPGTAIPSVRYTAPSMATEQFLKAANKSRREQDISELSHGRPEIVAPPDSYKSGRRIWRGILALFTD